MLSMTKCREKYMRKTKPLRILLPLLLVSITTIAWTNANTKSIEAKQEVEPSYEVVLASEVEWAQLNPARGDQSPKAGALWGKRTGFGSAGFLLKPVDGFKSPPHIHNIAYRGVVISGTIHNDDPNADEMYMSTGSFWTQPAGGIHITAAKGKNTLAYIEIEDAFGVLPAEKAFPSQEKPVNVDASNIVWVDYPGQESSTPKAKLAFLWGNPQDNNPSGILLKLPKKFTGVIESSGSELRAVVIQGNSKHQVAGKAESKDLTPGSYFGSQGNLSHQISSKEEEVIFYIRMKGKFKLTPAVKK